MGAEKHILLHIENLKKTYSNTNKSVLNNVSIDVFDEDFLCILGPSGCGKSTLIRCIAGYEQYDGKILMDNQNVNTPGKDRIMVFQDFNQLFPWKTVLQNVEYPLKINGLTNKKERLEKAQEYIEKVNLTQYKNYYPHQLSGGMKQRVAIARGMALGSRVILMDEPFAALDAISRNQMQNELIRLKETEKLTIIFITHNIQEAICMGNRVIVMSKDGNVAEQIEVNLEKPITPATEGYGSMWEHLNRMLNK